ncbi:MAG: ParB/RepB/Spo0J family partition protein [candidate division Zixibacteria bacterium]|jgi:ParB family chromosome partitioning protein|nr:ParB/RepB/Spo0J family partition protein [candidate division Zixibacteria bacterium]
MKRVALGRGLDALIPGAEPVIEKDDRKDIFDIEITRIKPNPYQPRRKFDDAKIAELAESIKQKGLIQPIVLRRFGDDYEVVVGERRLRAAQSLGLEKIPAIVYEEVSKQEMMELALVENIQRESLNPIEEAEAYRILIQECGITQTEVADRVGKDRSSIANTIRLLGLPEKLRQMVADETISEGHARVILAVPGEKEKIELALKAVKEGLSVRDLEHIVYGQPRKTRRQQKKILSAELSAVEEAFKKKLRTKVTIKPLAKGGRITIEYFDDDSLSRILDELKIFDNE